MTPLVFQIIPSLSAGGAERFVIELAARLPEYGYRTKLIVLFQGGPLRSLVQEKNIHWVQLADSLQVNRLSLTRRLSGLIQADEARRPAIVHTHLFGSDFWGGLSQMGIPRAQRPVMISTAHGFDQDDSLMRRLARRMIAPAFDRVVSISDEVKAYTIQKIGVSEKRTKTIDGMCLFQPSMRPMTSFHQPPRLVTVSRLIPQKGIQTVLKALADIPPPWQYTIVGSGPYERELKELAERLGISSRVIFAGLTMNVQEILQESDLFLFPSESEGLGSAVLEASWAGVPVLTSDLPPLRSIFSDQQRLPIHDVSAWTYAIHSTLESSRDALVSAQNLAPSIQSRFHPDMITKQYAELYGELLRNRM